MHKTPPQHSLADASIIRITVRAETAIEAFSYIKYLVGRSGFYKQHGYRVRLPAHPALQSLSKRGPRRIDWSALRRIFELQVYRRSDYAVPLRRIERELVAIKAAVPCVLQYGQRWRFVVRQRYTLVLTLYGMGGSYNYRTGRIVIRASPDGRFVRSPIEVVLHEMIHIGVERSFVRAYGLSHGEKESLVDHICIIGCGASLPGYKVARGGDQRFARFLKKRDLSVLRDSVKQYVSNRSRHRGARPGGRDTIARGITRRA